MLKRRLGSSCIVLGVLLAGCGQQATLHHTAPASAQKSAAEQVRLLSGASQGLRAQSLIPEALAVPDGNALFLRLVGVGDQIYTCTSGTAGYAWTFKAPRADLYGLVNTAGVAVRKVGTHFAGPTWQDDQDGSTVVGRAVQNVPAPFSLNGQPTIPWLLLEAKATTPAVTGAEGVFTKTTYIRRLFTLGGTAPSTGCDESTNGQELAVPYAALYEFYAAQK